MARRLGNYELLKKIGSGGMAEVWMGRRAGPSGVTKAVAIKLMAADLVDDPRFRRMFLSEARLSSLLSHQNVVQVFDVGEERGHGYLVMEWVDGLNLAQLGQVMRQAGMRMPFSVIAYVTGEVLRGLGYAHSLTHDGRPLAVIHRDVSPQNILVSVSGEVKVTDFGVSRAAQEDTSGLHVKGKVRYMAPEQVTGQALAPSADLFAVGAVLHELLESERFREGLDERQLYAQVAAGWVPSPKVTDVPPELEALRAHLLAPDPGRRPQQAEEALSVLLRSAPYRNASAELAQICRHFMGVEAPRSGVYSWPGTGTIRPDTDAPTVAVVPEGAAAADASTRVRTVDAVVAAPEPAPRPRWLGAWVAVAALAVATLATGLLFADVLRGREPLAVTAAPPVADPPDPDRAPEPVAPAVPVRSPSIAPAVPMAAGSTAAPAIDSVPAPADEGLRAVAPGLAAPTAASAAALPEVRAAPVRSRKPVGPPARVRLRLRRLLTAYVRIDGRREVVLEPTLDLDLPPGSHRFEWRSRPDEPWRAGDSYALEPGRTYVVRFSEAGPALEPG